MTLLQVAEHKAFADSAKDPKTSRYERSLIPILEGEHPEYVFVINNSMGYRRLESLKRFLAGLPSGSELRWNPGCERWGNEPLLNSEGDMQEFRSFLDKHRIKFTLVPSG